MEIIVKLVPERADCPAGSRLLFILSSKPVSEPRAWRSDALFPASCSATPIGGGSVGQRSAPSSNLLLACPHHPTIPSSAPASAWEAGAAGESLAHVLSKRSAVDFQSWRVICQTESRNSLFSARTRPSTSVGLIWIPWSTFNPYFLFYLDTNETPISVQRQENSFKRGWTPGLVYQRGFEAIQKWHVSVYDPPPICTSTSLTDCATTSLRVISQREV